MQDEKNRFNRKQQLKMRKKCAVYGPSSHELLNMEKQDIRNLSYEDIVRYLESIREKSFRAAQIFEWLYQKGVWSFDDMSNLSKDFRERLSKSFTLAPLNIAGKEISDDGTVKFLFDLEDRQKIETVLIPAETRTTACVSTQAGCKFGCQFCASGIGGWVRNLSAAEIVAQVLHIKEEAQKYNNPLSHIVYMGVGEPLDNFSNVMKSIRVMNDEKAVNIGARRITVSTCGLIPQIKQFAKEGLQMELAISLHGFDNKSRNILMPVNRIYPFDELMKTCRAYVTSTGRQITFEYLMIKDVTCTQEAVRALKKALKGLTCKINLIPYNSVSGFDHKAPSRSEIFAFKKRLQESGIHALIRTPRGCDISAACGQLRHNIPSQSLKTRTIECKRS